MSARLARWLPAARARPMVASLVLVLTLAGASIALAQAVITGRITDAESGQPVGEVQVELITAGRARVAQAFTDAEGRFRIEGAPAGSFSLVFSRLGYEVRRLDGVGVATAPVDVGTVSLVSRAFRMNPVVITPSRIEEKALKAPASTWVVDRRDVEARPATTAVDHVRDVPGVDVASNGLTQHTVVARGFSNVFSGALFVLTDYRWASVPSLRFNAYNLIPVTDEDLERIEIALGPGSALYGPNVTQGVMHLITRSPLEHTGTTASLVAGERDLVQVSGRHAGKIGERLGYKLSGSWLSGRDWIFHDPDEDSLRAAAIARGASPDTLRIGARDFDAMRLTADGRVDYRFAESSRLVLAGGFSQLGRSIELTEIGAAQGVNWRTSYVQARLRHRGLFAQTYVNFSDAGTSYTLRDGGLLHDRSLMGVGQLQHERTFGERERLIYGADLIHTVPRTQGTITGRNEDDDAITEIGGYAQSETRLAPRLDLVAAARLDYHSRLDQRVLSPRAALVFKAAEGHHLRLTYNRAFNQPSSNNLSLDIRSAQDFGGLPFDVRAAGVPSDGFHFERDPAGMPFMHSPFTPAGLGGPAQALPLDATLFWDTVVQILQSRGVDISDIPAPTAAQVGTVMRSLNPTTRTFTRVDDVTDVAPLQSQINNTIEAGYKGFFGGRATVGIDAWYSRIEHFISPALVVTPNVFLDRASLAAYLDDYMPTFQAIQLAAAIAGVDGSGSLTGIPLGAVTPVPSAGDPYDLILTFRNFGDVHLWGVDLGVNLVATERLGLRATYSFVNRNFFRNLDGIADVPLNAPRNKSSLSATWRDDRSGLTAELRGRYVDVFPMISGVYIGKVEAYALMDADVSWKLPWSRATELALVGTNLFDRRHREFVGAPALGRLVLVRVRRTF